MPQDKFLPDNILRVWVQPGAAKDELIGFRDGFLRLRVKARPEKGAANKACQKILGEALNIAPEKIKIIKGEQSRRKIIKILAENPSWERLK
ncbi:MAG: DUF167 domain-containing protein [Thermodesulfobacteriota bacterium]